MVSFMYGHDHTIGLDDDCSDEVFTAVTIDTPLQNTDNASEHDNARIHIISLKSLRVDANGVVFTGYNISRRSTLNRHFRSNGEYSSICKLPLLPTTYFGYTLFHPKDQMK